MTVPARPLRAVAPASVALAEHAFADGEALATALAQRIGNDLRAAIAARGDARVALSGGRTPRRFLQALAREDLDWSRVRVVPVGERWRSPVHARSNEGLLRECLLQGPAAAATLIRLLRPVPTPEAALQAVSARVAAQALPLDACVLGMGVDGHVASLYADMARRDVGLQPSGRAPVVAVRSALSPEPRMSLTLSALFTAAALYLHVEGDAKRRTVDAALADRRSRLPVRALLAQAPVVPALYWCPGRSPGEC